MLGMMEKGISFQCTIMWFANRNREKNIRMSYELTWVYGGGLVLK
jgi:hypothetical protein